MAKKKAEIDAQEGVDPEAQEGAEPEAEEAEVLVTDSSTQRLLYYGSEPVDPGDDLYPALLKFYEANGRPRAFIMRGDRYTVIRDGENVLFSLTT